MYTKILVPLENSAADRTILEHVERLAHLTHGSLLLLHVADGWAARHYEDLQLRESEEMQEDRAYLASVQRDLEARGLTVRTMLAAGDPAHEIARVAGEQAVDLIAMATHGHRLVGDLIHGATASHVRHAVRVPVLFVRVRD